MSLMIGAAYDLSEDRQRAMQNIARAATSAIPHGPVTVMHFDSDAQLDPDSVYFERADPDYISHFLEWQRVTSAVRQFALSLTPRAIHFRPDACVPLPDEFKAMARQLFPLCVMANTGDGGGLHVAFGDPDLRKWRPTRVRHFHEVALHLAAAWRLRRVLSADAMAPATAREALRHAVLAREQVRTHRRSAGEQELWPALAAGRWSLIDTFSVAGTRYIIAHENPAEPAKLRALSWREQSVLELTLAGRSGKWIAVDLQLSESAVTRTLRTALRKIGAADTSDLVGARTARFEPLDGPSPSVNLAVAQLKPAAPSLSSLSGAERAIVAGILGGKPIAAIARERGTSPRTVAHQIASTYRKLGVSSRRELLAQLI